MTVKFHVLWKWNQNNKIKFGVYQKTESVVFCYRILIAILIPKTTYLKMNSFSLDLPPLGSLKSHHHDLKPTWIQESNLQCSMINPYPNYLAHPKPCNHPTFLTLSPLYFGFHVATLILGLRPRQGFVRVRAKREARESHLMLLGV
jgi:hypothetical protein